MALTSIYSLKNKGGHHSSACVTCHSSQTSSTYEDLGGCKVPIVFYYDTSAPTEYLAGGNFWWVSEDHGADDTKGHNVFLGEDDDNLSKAPGATIISCGTNSCHEDLSQPYSGSDMVFVLNGKYGCQGCHLNVKHHAKDHPNFESGLVDSADKAGIVFSQDMVLLEKGSKAMSIKIGRQGIQILLQGELPTMSI